jgi:hypothetical protein
MSLVRKYIERRRILRLLAEIERSLAPGKRRADSPQR